MSRPPLHYVTLREGEDQASLSGLEAVYDSKGVATGIRWKDFEPRDWDDRRVLWVRTSQNWGPGRRLLGKPRFALMHPARQRETMMGLRCSVCCESPSRTAAGYLFLLEPEGTPLEGRLTVQPPLCLPHALYGINRCSLLAAGWTLVRSRVPRLFGVNGEILTLTPGGELDVVPKPVGPDGQELPIPYTERAITPWVLASQMVRRLTKVTEVDLDDELAAAGLAPELPRSDRLRL